MSVSLTVLDEFNGADGQYPHASLMTDAKGDLFGTTGRGGADGFGTVFEIAYDARTGYADVPTVLASFDGTDGGALEGNLIADANGDLFGTAEQGGATGYGTLFEIAKTADGYASTPEVLANFGFAAEPASGLIADAAGDLFGVTQQDGASGGGTVFELAKTASGYAATPTILVNFNALTDGNNPIGGLLADKAGDLFGTTDEGGANGDGTLFEIVKTAGGYASAPTVLVNFDAENPGHFNSLIADTDGNLFATSSGGGAYAGGDVYEVAKTTTGYASTATVLASFNGPIVHSAPELNTDGSYPIGTLLIDAQGDLFGTTEFGGVSGNGVAFEIKKTSSGYDTTPTVLQSFSFSGADGGEPTGGLVMGADGGLIGTTLEGGTNDAGAVYEITMPPPPETFSDVQPATGGPFDGTFLWSDAANWTDGVPFDNDSAISAAPGFDDVANLNLFELAFDDTGSVTAVQNLTVDTLVTNESAAVFASTTPRGAAASVILAIGAFSGSVGELGATGSGAVLDDTAASSPDAGLYTASAGGTIVVANDLAIGGATAGALEVESGGTVTSVNGDVGTGAGGGAVTVDGAGSSWSLSGALTIGASGGGASPSMTISNAASVTTSTDETSRDVLYSGSLTLTSGGKLTEVELSARDGTVLTVESGAVLTETVSSPNPGYVGLFGNGQIVLDNATLASANEFTDIGAKTAGISGDGTMTVSDGASATSLATYIGHDGGDTGSLLLDGLGTNWTDKYGSGVDANNAGVNVGVSGTGSLAITAGATLTNPLAYIKVAQFGGSAGTVVVSDAGSSLDAGGLLRVGDRGNGTMTVEDGATVSVGQVQVGDYNGSAGRLDIDSGASVSTSSASTIDVGPQAIQGGTIQVAAGSFELGVQAGSFGFVDVNDGTLTVEGDLTIGGSGSGTLSVESGGVVSAGDATVGVAATLFLNPGGTLQAASLTVHGGIFMSGGVLDPPGQIAVDAGGDISGFGTVVGAIDDTGRVTAAGGTLDVTGDVSGTGALTITSPGALQLDGTVTNAAGILFGGAGESLILGAAAKIETAISGLYNDDTVALDGQTIVSAVYTAATGELALAGSTGAAVDLTLLGAHRQNDFTLVDGELQVACFVRGTRVLTVRGEVAIEALREGDLVVTLLDPDAVLKPVRWLGHRRLDLRRHPNPDQVQPIRFCAGALGDGVPHGDLVVSPGHRILLDGVLMAACELVNGATVVQEQRNDVEYWHVELDQHDVLLAEGMAAESYHDVGNRDSFENGAVMSLHPVLDGRRHAREPCRPYATASATVRKRMMLRAEALGWTRSPEPEPWLEIKGQAFHPERDGDDYRFTLPIGCKSALLRSRVSRPRDMDALSDDDRRLGISIGHLKIQGLGDAIDVALDDARLSQGFWQVEVADGQIWRWTDGCAVLPVAALLAGARRLEIQTNPGMDYWSLSSQFPCQVSSRPASPG